MQSTVTFDEDSERYKRARQDSSSRYEDVNGTGVRSIEASSSPASV
jgi:hypothetical protein